MGKRKRRDDGDQGHPIDGRHRLPRGPYGTNEGDIWLAADWMQERIQAEKGPGWRVVIEMLDKDGAVQECLYTTEHAELVEMADRGHPRYIAAQAAMN